MRTIWLYPRKRSWGFRHNTGDAWCKIPENIDKGDVLPQDLNVSKVRSVPGKADQIVTGNSIENHQRFTCADDKVSKSASTTFARELLKNRHYTDCAGKR